MAKLAKNPAGSFLCYIVRHDKNTRYRFGVSMVCRQS